MESSSHLGDKEKIKDEFPDEKLLPLEVTELPWYADIVNFFVSDLFPPGPHIKGRSLVMILVSTYGMIRIYSRKGRTK